MTKLEKVIKGLECCCDVQSEWKDARYVCPTCPYIDNGILCETLAPLMADALALLKSLSAFKEYFEGLYGQGLDVANYHLNGATEPFDYFYDSAMEEYENARCD